MSNEWLDTRPHESSEVAQHGGKRDNEHTDASAASKNSNSTPFEGLLCWNKYERSRCIGRDNGWLDARCE